MIKKILSMTFMTLAVIGAFAQTPMPLNPAVKHGVLPNGLNYYILHNEEPKERANFYIAQKVGSTLETQEQLGLAHFLEHMAFNGTKNYPGKSMLNYLQSKGIRFGADINAYTSFDETVYNIDNVPTTDKALMDSVLLVLHDWSGSILLEEDEINAERGVIEEEWRSRNDAMNRQWTALLPAIYSEYQYQQMPIGKIDIIRNFAPQTIRDYYHKWYRPDQQGIVIVGDFDADEMEQKVKSLFSDIPMPENAAERTYPTVSDNKEPIYFYFSDKELQYPMARVSFKFDPVPFDFRNTVENYMQQKIIYEIITTMIDNRLDEFSKKPECKYAQAGVYFGNFYVSKTKESFNIIVIPKEDMQGAYEQALSIVAQACKTGFMQSEVVRARDELLATYEKAYNERNNTKTATLGRELCRHFVDNDPAPGVEVEYQLMQGALPMLPLEAYNETAKALLTPENQVIAISEPAKDEMVTISKENIVNALQNAINAEYEAYVDEVITDPLLAKAPVAGKVTSTKQGDFGTTVYTLSNGAKVVVLPTDYKKDEIMMSAYKSGGKRAYEGSEAIDVMLAGDYYDTANIGNFNQVKLQKYLAGKNVSLKYEIQNTVNEFTGQSTVKDFPTFMELLYASFTAVTPDKEAYDVMLDKVKVTLKNLDKNPQRIFSQAVAKTVYGGNPMYLEVTSEMLDKADLNREVEIFNQSVSNAADYTFLFVGNVDLESFVPMMETYIASLPSTGKKTVPADKSSINIVSGQVDNTFDCPMQVPSTMVLTNANGTNLTWSDDNAVKVSLIGDILDNIYTDTLREEEGGTYSPYAYGSFNQYTNTWSLVSWFQTNSEIQNKLIKRSYDETIKLLNEGASEANFTKAREAMMKQYEINVRTNGYWIKNLLSYERGFDAITNHKEHIENLTLADFNNFMKNLYNGKNFIKIVMTGVPETK